MLNTLFAIFLTCCALSGSSTQGASFREGDTSAIRRYNYYPEDRELVCRDGANRYTRALYGTHGAFRLETSDRPVFASFQRGACRNIRFYAVLDGEEIPLDSTFFSCTSRYLGGRRRYSLSHGTLRIDITSLASMRSDEGALWHVTASPESVCFRVLLCEARGSKFQRNGDLGIDDLTLFDAAPGREPLSTAEWCGEGYVVLKGNSLLTASGRSSSLFAEEERNFRDEEAFRDSVMSRVEINTPDPLFNTLGSILVAAADGLWDGKTWQHGCIGWRTPLAGWRGCYIGDAVGWLDRSYTHYKAYAASQVTDVAVVYPHPRQDSLQNMARAEKRWGTPMYSTGYICRYPERKDVMHHYDMNLNYIDGLLRHLSYDASEQKLREFWPVLVRHLEWEKRNFDPDGDFLYDAYCCIWASDALYYNGGAVTHSSAYNYRANRLAARIAELLGYDAMPYRVEAEGILKAMNERLWLPSKGHWAEYADLMGKGRVHESAALWSVYTPIDCGACTAEQAYRATRYVDRCIPHIPIVTDGGFEGFTLSTTDWMPYAWSTNNVAHEEVANMALAYFQAGRREVGFRLLKSDLTDEMLLGRSPGNFGQISFYDRERREAYRDFGDNIGVTGRAIVCGLFGISPDALYGRCVIQPSFPDAWHEASIRTPYLSYSYKREGTKEVYRIEQHFPQRLKISVRSSLGKGFFTETVGTDSLLQTIIVDRGTAHCAAGCEEGASWKEECEEERDATRSEAFLRSMGLEDFSPEGSARHVFTDLSASYNASITDIFRNRYLSPRPPYTTLQIPVQGIGEWCHPKTMAEIDDSGLRGCAVPVAGSSRLGVYDTRRGVKFLIPRMGSNVVFSSLWDNYPDEVLIPVKKGRYAAAYLMMAGTTNSMQSRIENALVVAHYSDGSSDTLRLVNPINWPTLTEEYVFDHAAFWSAPKMPWRFRFDNGAVAREINSPEIMPSSSWEQREKKVIGADNRYAIHHGAGVILKMCLNPQKRLTALRMVTLSNDIVVGLMGVTLER